MMMLTRGLAAAALVSALGACAYIDPEPVRSQPVSGGAFNVALHKDYLAIGDAERAEYDWRDSGNFYQMAQSAAANTWSAPYEMSFRDIAADKVDELSTARGRLMGVLGAGAKDVVPDLASKATTQWECWFQEQEEGHQPKDIAACREGFLQAMAAIDQALAPKPMAKAAPAPAPKAPDIEGIYIVYFEFDSAVLSPEARKTLDQAAVDYRSARIPSIQVKGHADRSGSTAYNERLGMRRAEAAAAYMARAGVPATIMRTVSFGETLPLVATPDGVREARNRRVEVVFE